MHGTGTRTEAGDLLAADGALGKDDAGLHFRMVVSKIRSRQA